ncbi:hypothetical protein EDC48_12288 [Gibbsiella quercinecans]|uniref:antirestriction protein ArdR n=1 Tax=Gibbsiella quercinecans TaxID=929813 RepID=UPI000BAFE29C|nr:antirestriction protein ArdR [Gibbsiella quercinecans]TCT82689.1 hypothetical protein EDC48_12288 [Gibbsiella quercinecans]
MVDVICISTSWRKEHPEHATSGIVLIRNNQPHDWKNRLRGAYYERPDVITINFDNHIFIAEGDNEYDSAKCWSDKK